MYNDVTALYDQAEELVATVESQFVADPEAQLAIVEPLITEIGDATDVLSEEFILIAENKKGKAAKASKTRIEAALRKIYVAVGDYQARVKGTRGALKNIADPVVAKIQRTVEKVLAIFLEFISISLTNIMNKAEVEALRIRDTRIAQMMHQHAIAQQQG
jgi:hypothetical protein